MIRIVSYNILDGGVGRADPIAEVIIAQKPDVVALVEADDPDVLARVGRRLNMDFIHAPAGKTAAALLSRWPIVDSVNYAAIRPELKRSFLVASIRLPRGMDLPVGVVHLSPHALEQSERQREGELAAVAEALAPLRSAGRPHLLCGDFNSNAPRQRIDIVACKTSTQEAYFRNGGSIPRRVIATLLESGYVDTLAAAHPRKSRVEGSFSTQSPGQRVDYIFAFGIDPSRVRHAWIERDRLARYASDHYPIGAQIAVSQPDGAAEGANHA